MGFVDNANKTIPEAESWIVSQRWYGDKARDVASLVPFAVRPIEIDSLDVALVIVEFAYERGLNTRYFVPLVSSLNIKPTEQSTDLSDALKEPEFLLWFIQGFAEDRGLDGNVQWRWRRLGDNFPDTSSIDQSQIRVISAEQSNTSVVFGNEFIVKIFRRMQPGTNPDLEIGEFLSTDDRFEHVPKLYGLVDIEDDQGVTAVAAVQQFVSNKGDGWSWLLEELEHLDCTTLPKLVESVALLGTRTAEMHVALASDSEHEAFTPEAFTEHDADALIKRVIAEMAESVEGLAKRLSPDELERLHKGIGGLMAGAWSLVGTFRTRVHGDYHLGQTLRTAEDDFVLIDFEGEPSRSMDERRMKQSPLKDVAGMLRSLDYAAATIIGAADGNADHHSLVKEWLSLATTAFENAYRAKASEASVRIVAEDDTAFRNGLNLLIAEKALYEIRYELNNRPHWLDIPINGIRRLAGIPVSENR